MKARGLGEHIANLLFEHDCVIIPGFGGFIANYKAAFVHPRSGDVYPPSKQISFNGSLKRNDGLLVSHLAERMALDYPAALQLVQQGVQEFNQELDSGRRLEIDRVGILYRDRDQRLRFIPNENNNFLRSSFGLPVLSIKPLLSGEPELSPGSETPVITYRRRLLRAAAIVLPITMAGSFFLGSWMHKNEFEMAGFSLFRSHEVKAVYSPQSETPASLTESYSAPSLTDLMESAPGNVLYINFENGEIDPSGIAVRIKPESLPETAPGSPEKEVTIKGGKMWFVIAGAFSIESNANKLVEELRGQGFDATLAGKKGNLHLVSSGVYTSPEAARSALDAFKTDSRNGWILSR